MEKKTILLIIHRLNHGGAEKILSQLSLMLEDVYNVIVITFDGQGQMYETGGQLIDLQLPASDNKVVQSINLIRRVRKVRNIKRDNSVSCSISFLNGPNLINYLSRYHDKVIMSVRTFLSGRKMGFFEKKYSELIYNLSDCTIAISDYVRDDLIQKFGANSNIVKTIYNPCDVDYIVAQGNACDNEGIEINHEMFNYVTVGRFHEAKGHWHLLRAFAQLCKKHDDVHLYMIGEGNLLDKTINLIKELKIEEKVTLTGFLKNPHQIVYQCDAFVFSSIYEGFGNVIVDALALRKPVISSDCYTGPRTILAPSTPVMYQTSEIEYGEYGILVPSGDSRNFNAIDALTHDEECLYEAMEIIKTDKQLREGYIGKGFGRAKELSVNVTKRKWVEIIESITTENN